jgi:hypothetical protein
MNCNSTMWLAVALNLTGLVFNVLATLRAIRSWDRADKALNEAIKARAEAIQDLLALHTESHTHELH